MYLQTIITLQLHTVRRKVHTYLQKKYFKITQTVRRKAWMSLQTIHSLQLHTVRKIITHVFTRDTLQ